MPKSTGPLSEQLGFTSTQAPSSQSNITDNTTSAADKLGANKGTNAIPQGVSLHPFLLLPNLPITSIVFYSSLFIYTHTNPNH
jgi:hypothetical protein